MKNPNSLTMEEAMNDPPRLTPEAAARIYTDAYNREVNRLRRFPPLTPEQLRRREKQRQSRMQPKCAECGNCLSQNSVENGIAHCPSCVRDMEEEELRQASNNRRSALAELNEEIAAQGLTEEQIEKITAVIRDSK